MWCDAIISKLMAYIYILFVYMDHMTQKLFTNK